MVFRKLMLTAFRLFSVFIFLNLFWACSGVNPLSPGAWVEEKNRIKAELHTTFGVRPRFPFIVVDKFAVDSGYNPDIWEEMLK